MKRPNVLLLLAPVVLVLAGCSSEPVPLTEPPQIDPATAKPDYWLSKPAAATIYCASYDKLWDICSQTAVVYFYAIDRQDYREGLLTTHPLVSKQIWEFWRHDAGDGYYEMQDTAQAIRRTIQFDFDRPSAGGCTVTPKVLIERFVQPNRRISSTGEYRPYFSPIDSKERANDYWYAIGRDYEMESALALAIKQKVGRDE
jgi:hypothetical protein